MIRHAAAVVLAIGLCQPWLQAQSTVFTVGASSAEVHKAPSNVTPVLGTAPRGAVLQVRRELGSWVSVSWPEANDGEAFVHVSRGSISRAGGRAPANPVNASARTAAPSGSTRSIVSADVRRVEQSMLVRAQSPLRPAYDTPPHALGVGGRLGGTTLSGYGISARAWGERLGVQVNLSKDTLTSATGAGRLTSTHLDPAVLFAPADRVMDYVWIRPYVGSGLAFRRQSLRTGTSGIPGPAENGFAVQAFGGSELTFASLPSLTLSADMGYRWARTSPPGFSLTGPIFSVSAHWYAR